MAKLIVDGFEGLEADLNALGGRENARQIVAAGCAAAIKVLQARTEAAHHVATGSMLESFAPGRYHEDLDECWQEVYPQGNDGRGISNAKKAFIINAGRGGHKTRKTGDKFITGKKNELEDAVGAAMRAEAERIKNDITR